jgi:DNA-binding NtrC family response regulator
MTTILIIDDEEILTSVFEMYLVDYDYTVLVGGTAEEGLKLLESNEIDIVIVDVRLPGMNGIDFIRLASKKYDADFIIYSGLQVPKIPEATASIQKPIELKLFLNKIREIEVNRNKSK